MTWLERRRNVRKMKNVGGIGFFGIWINPGFFHILFSWRGEAEQD